MNKLVKKGSVIMLFPFKKIFDFLEKKKTGSISAIIVSLAVVIYSVAAQAQEQAAFEQAALAAKEAQEQAALAKVASAPVWHMVNCNTTSQGDCHLLEDNSVYTMIDAGQPQIAKVELIPYLIARRIYEIEHFFISHPHTDHYGGLREMINAGIRVKNIYYNAPPADVSDFNYKPSAFRALLDDCEATGAKLHNVGAGFGLKLPNSKIHILEAKKTHQGDVNDYSLIMTWDAGGYRTLFTGDLNRRLGTKLAEIEQYKADILKVPHHGVTGIAPNEFFDNVNPSLLMLPAHRLLWNHPRGTQVREWAQKNWKEKGTYICNNGFNGDVRIAFHSNFLGLDPQKPSGACPRRNWYLEPKEKPRLLTRGSVPIGAIVRLLLEDK